MRLVELIEFVLDRGDLGFEMPGGECVDSRFFELRYPPDLTGGKRETSTFLKHALAGIEGFDRGDETFEFRETEDTLDRSPS